MAVVDVVLRRYEPSDHEAVRKLFVATNRAMAPSGMRDQFERYIQHALREEIDRIPDYYGARDGQFWIALSDGELAGTFAWERSGPTSAELRRMYVRDGYRRQGVGRTMLIAAEERCRQAKYEILHLSTSELQTEALNLYRSAGCALVRTEVAQAISNRTAGGGLLRYHFEKSLSGK
jgi:GNAT superfamily N-acetyltransferase